jgi:transposase
MEGGSHVPCLCGGTCDPEVVNFWLETLLCPRLTAAHVVIMDNAASHEAPETARLIEKAGATLLFLSPYSPDFNPIAKDCAAVKRNREYNEHGTLDNIVKHYQ